MRKPGAFARYVYRGELFPSPAIRRAYDAPHPPEHRCTAGDLEYLRILHAAASTMEADVEATLTLLLAEGRPVTCEGVKALVAAEGRPAPPALAPPEVDLRAYDTLLEGVGT